MSKRRIAVIGVLLCGFALLVRADVDPADYELKSSLRSDKERQRMKALLEAEKKLEQEQQQREAEAEAKRLAGARARMEARPYPVKLTERQCTRCHVSANYENQGHTLPGWWAVVLRMRHFNGAEFGPGELSVIASHLAETRPPDTAALLQEYGLLVVALGAPPLLAWGLVRYRRNRHKRMHS